MSKTALITGISGQDGSYLAELLLSKNYQVHGLLRRNNSEQTSNIDAIKDDLHLHMGDLSDTSNLVNLILDIRPDEVYNLAAQSHVHMSFDAPEITTNVNGLGVLKLLEAVKLVPGTRFYQASTSEMFGIVQAVPQNETTAFRPVSPYGTAKLFGYWTTINYRESYGVHASNGILFNHESPRRGLNFVTRKITNGLAKYKILDAPPIRLGNLDALRDWGHARDYVEGMWLMVQQSDPGDYVLATGQQHSVRQFCQYACQYFDIDLVWQGQGINEIGINTKTGQTVFEIDPRFYRPSDVNTLLGDSTLAKSQLGWSPKTTLQDLVEEMCSNDSELISKLQREK